jgi:hypothetical protein
MNDPATLLEGDSAAVVASIDATTAPNSIAAAEGGRRIIRQLLQTDSPDWRVVCKQLAGSPVDGSRAALAMAIRDIAPKDVHLADQLATHLLEDEADWVREEAAFSVLQAAPLLGDSFLDYATTHKNAVRKGISAGIFAAPVLYVGAVILGAWLYFSSGGPLFGPSDSGPSQAWQDMTTFVLLVVVFLLDLAVGYGVYRWKIRRAASDLLKRHRASALHDEDERQA